MKLFFTFKLFVTPKNKGKLEEIILIATHCTQRHFTSQFHFLLCKSLFEHDSL